MFVLSLLLSVPREPGAVHPPMHRAWTKLSDDRTEVLEVSGGTLIYASVNKIRALYIRTGSAKWTRNFVGQIPTNSTINSSTVFADIYTKGRPSRVVTLDRRTGAMKEFGQPFKGGHSREIACDEKRLYLLEGSLIRAIDITSKKEVWKTDLSKGQKGRAGWLASLSAGSGKVFAGVDQLGFHSIDATNGKVLWKENAQYGVYNKPLILPKGVLTRFKGFRLQNFVTGKPIWTAKLESFEPAKLEGNVLMGISGEKPCAIDITDGKTLWQWNAPGKGYMRIGISEGSLQLGMGEGAISTYSDEDRTKEVARLVDKAGNEKWSVPTFFDGNPIYLDDEVLICNDHERLLGYTAGAPAAIPSDEGGKKALAQKLANEFELLDKTEWNTFAEIGQSASKTLIEKYTQWALDNREDGPADKEGRGQRLYGLLTESPRILEKVCSPENTNQLVAAIDKLGEKNSYVGALTTILGKRGDPDRSIPKFIDRLRKNRNKPRDDWEALTAIAESSHPAAVKFMIDALADPKAPAEWRHAAFIHLAGTGGAVGVEAVRQARAKSGPRPTWQTALMNQFETKDVLSQLKDAKGKSWRLVKSGVLGNYGDLFIQPKTDTGWGPAVFVDFSTERTFTREAPKSYKGININKLVESEWVKVLVEDAGLRKDSDKDGLTDLVEGRLGTDPAKADTDGDGLLDSVDPCPTAAPRALGDQEKIIAACVEAQFFAYGYPLPPADISVENVKPFELYGYPAPLIWPVARSGSGLAASYGAGMNSITIQPPMDDFSDRERGKDLIRYSDGGTTAETLISRYSGGLNGEGVAVKLKKIGDEWFVVYMQTRYVS